MLERVALEELTITDEQSLLEVAPYRALKQALLEDAVEYLVLPEGPLARWDQALLLNLTFWQPGQQNDVLEGPSVPADVVAHRAWHHLAHRELGAAATTPQGLMLGEAIASAFDVYLVGTLLAREPEAGMLESQVPAMVDVMAQAGLEDDAIDALLQRVARAPRVAFAQLRELLYDVGVALCAARDVDAAAQVLLDHAAHPYAPLLHHYELSSWTLYARAFGSAAPADPVATIDRQLRDAGDALAWLTEHWL